MKQIIGSPAEGEKFYPRQYIRNKFFEELDKGNNILVSAPRRVGKTSVLMDLQAQRSDNYYMVYVITESVNNSNQFFKRLINAIIDTDTISNYGKFQAKSREWIKQFTSSFRSVSLADATLDLSGDSKVNYFEQFKTLLRDADLGGKQIVLMIDEFPITIENIREEQSVDAAVSFLKQCRELRQDPAFKSKVKFIYTGSIGLFSVVRDFNATSELNDIFEIKINQLSNSEAQEFASLLLQEHEIATSPENIDYLLTKVDWLIPFHIQLLVKEVKDLHDLEPAILSDDFIDKAFRNVVKNGDIYFDHYRGRLSKVFSKDEIKYINELLQALSLVSTIETAQALDMATKHGLQKRFKSIINSLIYDGYIVETDDEEGYQFYSPILKAWWKRNG